MEEDTGGNRPEEHVRLGSAAPQTESGSFIEDGVGNHGDNNSLMVEEEAVYKLFTPFFTSSSDHPTKLCESSDLASINVDYMLQRPKSEPERIYSGTNAPVSNAQIQAVMLMMNAHQQRFTIEPGREARLGFINGDGPGVGKTRELCFGIKENEAEGRRKHVWLSASTRLFDGIEEELKNVESSLKIIKFGEKGITEIVTEPDGVAVLTYNLLSMGTPKTPNPKKAQKSKSKRKDSKALLSMTLRYKQLYDWMTKDGEFDGLLILDEYHIAKSFNQESHSVKTSKASSPVPSSSKELSDSEDESLSGTEVSTGDNHSPNDEPKGAHQSKNTKTIDEGTQADAKTLKLGGSKTHQIVVRLQYEHLNARVVYSSPTCTSEIDNYGYMVRLSLWGPEKDIKSAHEFIKILKQKGQVAKEFLTMTLKRKGLLIARQLSFEGANFNVVKVPHLDSFELTWRKSSELWLSMFRNLQWKFEKGLISKQKRKSLMSKFWLACQKYFRTLIFSSKISHAAKLGRDFVASGKYEIVYGLQGTGESGSNERLSIDWSGAYSLSRHELKQGFAVINIEIPDTSTLGKSSKTVDHFIDNAKQVGKENRGDDHSQEGQDDMGGNEKYNYDGKNADDEEDSDYEESKDTSNDGDESYQIDPNIISNKTSSIFESTDISSATLAEPESDSESEKERVQQILAVTEKLENRQCDSDFFHQSSMESKKRKRAQKKLTKKQRRHSVDTPDTHKEINTLESGPTEKEAKQRKFGIGEDGKFSNYPEGTLGWSRGLRISQNLPPNTEVFYDEYLIYLFNELENWLPVNPLDNLIRLLGGPENVAEITGRKTGYEYLDGIPGSKVWKSYDCANKENLKKGKGKKTRTKDPNNEEVEFFQSGKKSIVVVSDVASNRFSKHCSKENPTGEWKIQKHIQLEFLWSLEKTVHQMGRTNRSNRITPPFEYILLQSVVPCEIRFESLVASRLKTLGASYQGEGYVNLLARLISDKNYESCGKKALANLKHLVSRVDHKPARKKLLEKLCSVGVLKRLGDDLFSMEPGMCSDLKKLLNRAIALPISDQQKVIDLLNKLIANVVREEHNELKRATTMSVFDPRYFITEVQLDSFSDGQNTAFLGKYRISRMTSWILLSKYIDGGKVKFYYRCWKHRSTETREILCALKLQKGYGVFHPWNRVMSVVQESRLSKDDWKMLPATDDPQAIWEQQHAGMRNIRCIHLYLYGECNHEYCRDDWGITSANVLYGDILDKWSKVQALVDAPKIVKFQVSHGNGRPKTLVFGIEIPQDRLKDTKSIFRGWNV